ncbi:MAG: SEC-C domain-containing protein [Deltaproteobacteria bacterium]|nr:SEC-C domain-containing protein [Deltaproteobacteria bacterium]
MIRPYPRRTWDKARCPCGSDRRYRNCCGKRNPQRP